MTAGEPRDAAPGAPPDGRAAFDHVPAAVRRLLPELATLPLPAEPHADCARCPQVAEPRHGWSFLPETRCCTAQPPTPNFLLGRALRRGDPGRRLVLARLARPSGVTAWGVDVPPEQEQAYYAAIGTRWGRDVALRCPFWAGGEHTCGVWHDRTGLCRTWYCKFDGGLAGAVAWGKVSTLLSHVELQLGLWAVRRGDPPAEPAPAAAWAAWYERAADLVDAATEDDLAPLATEALARRRDELGGFVEVARLRRRRGLPARLVPAVSERLRVGADVLLTGYSSFDAVRAPAAVFELLARLDGDAPWRDALEATRAALAARGEPTGWLDDGLVAELHRVGALRDPAGADDLPYHVDTSEMDRWSRV